MKCSGQRRGPAGWSMVAAIAVLSVATTAMPAQDTKTPEVSPGELVRLTVANEVAAANHPELHHMFRSRRQTPKGSQTRLYVETNQALAGMLIAINNQPLTAEQQKAEFDHLALLVNKPEQLGKKEA